MSRRMTSIFYLPVLARAFKNTRPGVTILLMLYAQNSVAQAQEDTLPLMIAGITVAFIISGTISYVIHRRKIMGTTNDEDALKPLETPSNVDDIDKIANTDHSAPDIKNHGNKFM